MVWDSFMKMGGKNDFQNDLIKASYSMKGAPS